ncbi:MAG: hypothetical protein JW803_02805 [Endomicrobiales bacterium]|nr:hypothetical protein [Endomicrobiales bacterium]
MKKTLLVVLFLLPFAFPHVKAAPPKKLKISRTSITPCEKILDYGKELRLDKEQTAKISENIEEYKRKCAEIQKEMASARAIQKTALKKKKGGKTAARKHMNEISNLARKLSRCREEANEKNMALLTKEQREQYLDILSREPKKTRSKKPLKKRNSKIRK